MRQIFRRLFSPKHPLFVGLFASFLSLIILLYLAQAILEIPRLNNKLAVAWFLIIIVYEVFVVIFLAGLDKIIENNNTNGQHYVGISIFSIAFMLYGILIISYAPLYNSRIYDGKEVVKSIFTCVYFSSMTITTVGYGDVTPDHGLGRLFASAEAVSGFFILVLLASTFGKVSFQHRSNLKITSPSATQNVAGSLPQAAAGKQPRTKL